MKDVCFTGHRNIQFGQYREKLYDTLDKLINDGSDMFYAGGAAGFDTLAAQTVLDLKVMYPWISLVLVLPCPPEEQTALFHDSQRDVYYDIFRSADSIEVVSPHYTADCMKRRNQALVDRAEICVCCYNPALFKSGTGQTVRMAEKKGIGIINLFEDE